MQLSVLREAISKSQPRTLIIHIGHHKTGSTSVQHALALEQVKINGIAPFYGAALTHNHLVRHGKEIVRETNKASVGHQYFLELANGMRQNFANTDNRICVISAEDFEHFPPAHLRKLVNTYFATMFDVVKVICYVRPHLQRTVSSFTETTKIGLCTDDMETYFQQCTESGIFLYAPDLAKWRKVFGDNFIVRPSIRSEMQGGSLINDLFMSTLDAPQIAVAEVDNQNESLTLEDLLRVKFLHKQLRKRTRGFHHAYGWTLMRLTEKLPKSRNATKIQMHRSLAERAHEFYLEDARELDATYFGGRPLMQTALQEGLDKACEKAQPSTAQQVFNKSEIRSLRLAALMINELLINEEQRWPDFLHQRRLDAM
ncbi:MAG: hypothetical protein VX974_06125 [Pseudomonadota bacterium]|nr:hypothetical protein [Pseudomonadota bacterium]